MFYTPEYVLWTVWWLSFGGDLSAGPPQLLPDCYPLHDVRPDGGVRPGADKINIHLKILNQLTKIYN